MGRRTGLLGGATILLTLALAAQAAAQGPEVGGDGLCEDGIECVYDVPFKSAGGLTLTLDVYRPAGNEDDLPAVVAVHGGGFRLGDKKDMEPEAEQLARDGFAVFAPNYRTEECAANCDEDGDGVQDSAYWGTAGYDDLYEDLADSVAWVRRHGDEFGAATTLVGAFGTSAGAQLALRLNYRGEPGRERTDAAVGWSGAYVIDLRYFGLDVDEPDATKGIAYGEGKTLTGCEWASTVECSELWIEQSVTTYVDDCGSVACEGPARMVMGQNEGVIDEDAQAEIMVEVLEDAGIEATNRTYAPGESCLTGVAPVPAQGCGSGPGDKYEGDRQAIRGDRGLSAQNRVADSTITQKGDLSLDATTRHGHAGPALGMAYQGEAVLNIRNQKDFWSAVMFIIFGVLFIVWSRNTSSARPNGWGRATSPWFSASCWWSWASWSPCRPSSAMRRKPTSRRSAGAACWSSSARWCCTPSCCRAWASSSRWWC